MRARESGLARIGLFLDMRTSSRMILSYCGVLIIPVQYISRCRFGVIIITIIIRLLVE